MFGKVEKDTCVSMLLDEVAMNYWRQTGSII
jgi:hypothetical protein